MNKLNLMLMCLIGWHFGQAQNVGIGTTNPASSAQLDVSSTTKGFLMPRMTTAQRNAIVSPAVGLQVFNLDDQCTDLYDGTNSIKNCGFKVTGPATDPYHPTSNSWAQKANFGGTGRLYAVGFSIGNKGYLGTGWDGFSNKSDFWKYDPLINAWTQKANFANGVRFSAVGFSIGSKGYLGTGRTLSGNFKDFWEYDPATNSWTEKANFGGSARYRAVGFSIGSKGYIGTGNDGVEKDDFWEYDPSSDTWTMKANFGGGPREAAVGFGTGGMGFIGFGRGGSRLWWDDFWQYDPFSDEWDQKSSLGDRERFFAVGFSIGSKGYIGTGAHDDGRLNDFWEYDLLTNVWTPKANFGGGNRESAVGFSIGNRGYIGTGGGANFSNDFWEYLDNNATGIAYSTAAPLAQGNSISDGAWSLYNGTVFNANTGNVGIGTNNPANKLEVTGEGGFKASSTNTGTGANDWIAGNFGGTAGDRVVIGIIGGKAGIGGHNQTLSSWADLILNPGGGNVGIGTSAPAEKLDVAGGIKALTTLTAGGLSTAGIVTNTAAGLLGTTSVVPVTNGGTGTGTAFTAGSLVFAGASGLYSQNNAQLFWNNSNQRLGIGTIAPTNKLTVSGTGGIISSTTNTGITTADWIAGNFGGNGGNRVVMGQLNGNATIGGHNNALAAWANLLINPDGGNVGIGTNNPTQKLTVSGNVNILGLGGPGNRRVYADANGTLNVADDAGCVVRTQNWTANATGKLYTAGTYEAPSAIVTDGTYGDTRLATSGDYNGVTGNPLSTGVFTAPTEGYYMVSVQLSDLVASSRLWLVASLNGNVPSDFIDQPILNQCASCFDFTFSKIIYLFEGDNHRILRHTSGVAINNMIVSYRKL